MAIRQERTVGSKAMTAAPAKLFRALGAVAILSSSKLALAAENEGFVSMHNGVCAYAWVHLEQRNDQVYIEGVSSIGIANEVNGPCESLLAASRGQMISYTLWKWDGTTSVLCGGDPGWPGVETQGPWYPDLYLYSPSISGPPPENVTLPGCGPGYYNVALHAWYDDSDGPVGVPVWSGGTLFSGWVNMNIPDPPAGPK